MTDDRSMALTTNKKQAIPVAPKKPAPKKPALPPRAAPAKAAPAKAAPAPTSKLPSRTARPGSQPAALVAPVARFSFAAVPIIRDPALLTLRLREQLVIDLRASTGRVTAVDRIPTTVFRPGVVCWRVMDNGKPRWDVVRDTAFFADSAAPVGLERVAGVWQATGRGSERSDGLDLIHLAWELMRDWPGRRLPLGPEPRVGQRCTPLPWLPEQPWPVDTMFV
jgi:hypothetical protein